MAGKDSPINAQRSDTEEAKFYIGLHTMVRVVADGKVKESR
jgi:hypothetical protein